jgi:hypothetical protein
MKESSRVDRQAPRAETPRAAAHGDNGADATRGEPLALRAQKRKDELEVALQKLPEDELRARDDIELELTSVDALRTGDPADGTPVAAREHRALAWAAAGSLAVMFWLVRPIGLGILVGTLLAFLAQPACNV